jgi:hypothetical protein
MSTITFTASSTLAQNVGAHVNVIVDGVKIGSTYVGSTTKTYSFTAANLALNTAHDVQIVYDNDAVVSGVDRNLLLNSISVDGKTFAATSAYEVYHATGGPGNIASSGNMYWAGTAEFSLPASLFPSPTTTTTTTTTSTTPTSTTTTTGTGPDTITFTASAALAQNVGAHVNVIVDGKNIGSTYVGATTATYSFNTTLTSNSAHDVQLVYDNDAVVSGVDRNLLLQSIGINGKTYAATSAYEVYHATGGPGDIASSGNMYWNGTAEFSLPASEFSSTTTTTSGSTTTTTSGSTTTTTTAPGFYVSASGVSGGTGTSSNPFGTLQQALKAAEGSTTKTIYLQGGTYHFGSTVNLGTADNGITIQSVPGSQAVLDGGGSLSTLIQLNGSTGVTLQGLTFQNTAANTRAALDLNGASGNTIVANHFVNNGEAMLVDNGSNNNKVTGNQFDNSSTSAVEVQNQSNGNLFDSNLVNGTGAIDCTGGGFFVHGGNNNVISHNLVENTSGIGIGIENWDSTTVNVGNSIIGNIVQNSNMSSSTTDSGAIYELGRSNVDTKSVISGNYISGPNQAASPGGHIIGIYLDDNTSGVQITNNIVANTVANSVQIHGGNNITIQNNIFDLGANGLSAILFQDRASDVGGPTMANDVVQGNIIVSTSGSPTAFDNISGGAPTINNNFFMDLINSNFQTNGLAQTNAHYGNAQFVNEAGGNYTLGSNSGATSIGFTSIDQSVMGLHPTTAHYYA